MSVVYIPEGKCDSGHLHSSSEEDDWIYNLNTEASNITVYTTLDEALDTMTVYGTYSVIEIAVPKTTIRDNTINVATLKGTEIQATVARDKDVTRRAVTALAAFS